MWENEPNLSRFTGRQKHPSRGDLRHFVWVCTTSRTPPSLRKRVNGKTIYVGKILQGATTPACRKFDDMWDLMLCFAKFDVVLSVELYPRRKFDFTPILRDFTRDFVVPAPDPLSQRGCRPRRRVFLSPRINLVHKPTFPPTLTIQNHTRHQIL